jgi:FHA domain
MIPLTLGRNQDNDWIIPQNEVSGVHARAFYNDLGEIVLEDLDSRNGTLVNDRKIRQAIIGIDSRISLGGISVDFIELKRKLRYTEEFLQLKNVFYNFKNNIENVRKEDEKKNFFIRLGWSLTPLIVVFFFKNTIPQNLKVLFYMCSPIIFMIVTYIKQLNPKSKRKLEELSERFLIEYRCPSCRCSLGSTPWNVLAEQKFCTTCKAIWMIEKPLN